MNFGGIVVNNYVLVTKYGLIVIDTGYQEGFSSFSRKLAKNGFSFSDIAYIFITHVHDDHVGFLKYLLENTEATVILHSEAIERLKKGHHLFIGGCSNRLALLFCKFMMILGKGKHIFPPVNLSSNTILANEDSNFFHSIGIPADILVLPGHTNDSIGLLLEEDKLFCGDATMNNFPSIARNIIWIENLDDYQQSWDKMINSKARFIYPGHGKPFPIQDLVRFRHSMDGKQLYPL